MASEPSPYRITSFVIQGVEFTREGVFELDDGRRNLFIDKGIIRRCAFRRGFVAERAVVSLAVGAGLVAAGVFALYRVAFFSDAHWPLTVVRAAAMGSIFLLLGFIVLRHALRRGVYLGLDTDRGVRKLTVGKSATILELRAACDHIQRIGYVVELPVSGYGDVG